MLVFVLRSMMDCSNHGPSAGRDLIELTLPGHKPNLDTSLPRFWITRFMGRRIVLPGDPILDFEDKEIESLGGWMHSGNYANTSDSRFTTFSEHPIPIYDRREDGRYMSGCDPVIQRNTNAERFNSQAYRMMADVLNQAVALLVKRGGGPLTAHLSQIAADLLKQVNKPPMFVPMTRDLAPAPSLIPTLQAEQEFLAQLVQAAQGTAEAQHLKTVSAKVVDVLGRLGYTSKGKE